MNLLNILSLIVEISVMVMGFVMAFSKKKDLRIGDCSHVRDLCFLRFCKIHFLEYSSDRV